MAWLAGWAKRVKITVDSAGAKVPANLTWFPTLVHLSSSCGKDGQDLTCVFDEVGVNSKKIAFTKSDGTTELYAEIEYWNAGEEEAWIWVSKDGWAIDSGADTDFYIYFDNAQPDNNVMIGDAGIAGRGGPRESVWDDSFVAVWHLQEETFEGGGMRIDSTKEDSDMTVQDITDPTVAGKVDTADDFENNNTDQHTRGDDATLDMVTQVTLELWCKPESVGDINLDSPFEKRENGQIDPKQNYAILLNQVPLIYFGAGDGVAGHWLSSGVTPVAGTWYHIVGTYEKTDKQYIYVDGLEKASVAATWNLYTTGTHTSRMGCGGATVARWFDGIIDEVRISNVRRSGAYIKATYESGQDNLLSYGAEETPPVVVAVGDSIVPIMQVLDIV